jgi:hypothetical protein
MTLPNAIRNHQYLTLKDLANALLDRDEIIKSLLALIVELIGSDAEKYQVVQKARAEMAGK